MKKLMAIVVCLGMVVFAGIAGATTYQFEDMIDYWNIPGTDYGEYRTTDHWFDSVFIGQNDPLSYSHDINDDVDLLAGDLVTEATLELDFTNDLNDGHGWLFGLRYDFREFVRVAYDGNGWTEIGEQDNGQYDLVLDIDWLNDDGFLDVTIQAGNPLGTATAWLDHSRLSGTATTAAPVPEPATVMLVGTGLLGMIAFGRKRFNKKA